MTPGEQKKLDDRLIVYAKIGYAEMVRTLLATGAGVRALDDGALWGAICNGHAETVTVLLAAGADVHVRDDLALFCAAGWGHSETVQALLAGGADIHAGNDEALRLAARYKHAQTVRILLAAGANGHAVGDEALREALKSQEAVRLEFEIQQNLLCAGTGLMFADSRPEDIEALLRDAMAEQERMRHPSRADAPPRDYVPLPQPKPL